MLRYVGRPQYVARRWQQHRGGVDSGRAQQPSPDRHRLLPQLRPLPQPSSQEQLFHAALSSNQRGSAADRFAFFATKVRVRRRRALSERTFLGRSSASSGRDAADSQYAEGVRIAFGKYKYCYFYSGTLVKRSF